VLFDAGPGLQAIVEQEEIKRRQDAERIEYNLQDEDR
jgi:hypothetical protein